MIPYGKQSIDDKDIQAVIDVLNSNWLTTGPKVLEFEDALAKIVDAKYGVAVCSGTAALHCAMYALGIGPGDEVIVPPITFVATANCVVYQGATPVFADVDKETLLIDPNQVKERITSRTRAIIGVDYAGQPCDWDALQLIAKKFNLPLISDGCHALGGMYKGRKIGSLADMSVFSFHPLKHITTGEGGMIVSNNKDWVNKIRIFRNHGITTDHHQREKLESWYYEMKFLGYNYRITDIQCALGLNQLQKLTKWIDRRQEIADQYDEAMADIPGIKTLGLRSDVLPAKEYLRCLVSDPKHISSRSIHAYHLYVIRIEKNRDKIFSQLRKAGIGVNVHYIPVYLHPFYQNRMGTIHGLCPNAELAYGQLLSLPIYPALKNKEVKKVISSLQRLII